MAEDHRPRCQYPAMHRAQSTPVRFGSTSSKRLATSAQALEPATLYAYSSLLFRKWHHVGCLFMEKFCGAVIAYQTDDAGLEHLDFKGSGLIAL